MSPTPLFDRYAPDDPCASRHKGAETSESAFEHVRPSRERLHAMILLALKSLGAEGDHVEGLARGLRLRYTTVSARVSELKRLGLVVDSGRRKHTSTGCTAMVVVLKEFLY